MSYFIVWMDRENAKVFRFHDGTHERWEIGSRVPDHHTHRTDAFDHQRREGALFEQLVEMLSQAERFVIIGPGVAKHHFQNHLVEHFPRLAKKVVACEAVDHPTDPQIAALSKKFFGPYGVLPSF